MVSAHPFLSLKFPYVCGLNKAPSSFLDAAVLLVFRLLLPAVNYFKISLRRVLFSKYSVDEMAGMKWARFWDFKRPGRTLVAVLEWGTCGIMESKPEWAQAKCCRF